MTIQKQFIIEITREPGAKVGKLHTLGPYTSDDGRRAAYRELREQGREVYALDVHHGGEVYERPYFREGER